MKGITLGYGICGSFCTHAKNLEVLKEIVQSDKYEVIPILSETVCSTDTRFGSASHFKTSVESICGTRAVCSVREAEPFGPARPLDVLVISPCTGNTLAKIAGGITDTSVTMAAKAHLRNNRPLLIALATNDTLSGSAANIGKLLNTKNIYFVPFGQDDPIKKSTSMICDFTKILPSAKSALEGKQIQPLLI